MNDLPSGSPRHAEILGLAVALLIAWIGADASAEEGLVRGLRLQWNAAKPVHFDARLRTRNASFSSPQNLSLDAGSTGAFQISPDNRSFAIQPSGPTERGGVDIRVSGDPESTIAIDVRVTSGPDVLVPAENDSPIIVRLADLDRSSEPIEVAGGLRLWIQATPGEEIRPDFGRDSMVFWSGEHFPLQIGIAGVPTADGEAVEMRLRVRSARGGSVVSESQWSVPVATAGRRVEIDAGTLQMPEVEGAYDFEFECLQPQPRNLPLLPEDAKPILRRSVQVVVVRKPARKESDDRVRPAGPASDTEAASLLPVETIGRIQPLGKSWSIPRFVPSMPQAFSNVSKLLPNESGAFTSGPLGEEIHAGEKVAVLAPAGWYAHPLPIAEKGRPHVAVIRYPVAQSMRMGVSIVQQDAAGRVPPLGTDSGLATDIPIDVVSSDPWGEHRIVFWPHCEQPFIVLANHDTSEPARFVSIQIQAAPKNLAATVDGAAEIEDRRPDRSNRLAALYLDKPLLAECFGDEGALDAKSGAVLEDWVTFLKSAQRLTDYLQWAGFNGAIVTVSSEGGTLYPTDLFHATPRFDNGAFSSAGHDPVRKDVLELLFRLFDRAGLRLVPAIELATPLSALERQRRQREAFSGIEPVDARGRSLLTERPPKKGVAPYYNPLDGRVQKQIADAVAELTRRYGSHDSFEGIGMHLGPQTYLQLPDANWCRDRGTLAKFTAEHPAAPKEIGALQAWIDGPGREAFIDWRAATMTRFYADLARATNGKRLLLLTADSSVPVDTDRANGLDWSRLSELENVIPMRLLRESSFRDAVQQSQDASANENLDWDQMLAPSPAVGGLVFHPPADLKISGFGDKAPPTAGRSRGKWFTHAIPTGARYRRQLTGLMDQMDPRVLAIGGWTAPLGQEHQLRETLRTFAALPAARMRPVLPSDGRPSNVRLRQVTTESRTIVSIVNLGPWSVDVDVVFDQPVQTRPLRNRPANIEDSEGTAKDLREENLREENLRENLREEKRLWEEKPRELWRTTVPSGAVSAIEVNPGGSKVRQWNAQPTGGTELVQRLKHGTRELASRVAILSTPRLYNPLPNSGFEKSSEHGSIAGWLHAQHPPDCVQIVERGFESDHSVRLSNASAGGAKTWIVSGEIQPPPTGRLAVSLQVRALAKEGTSDESAQLRVAIEGWNRGVPIRRDVVLTPKLDGRWQANPLWLEVEDVGAEDVEHLRLTIDLLSSGDVWLDDIRLYDFFLTESERAELQSRAFLALERLRRGSLTPAARLFDSHWGRYLMALRVDVPAEQGKITQEIGAKPAEGLADRLRKWLPTPMY